MKKKVDRIADAAKALSALSVKDLSGFNAEVRNMICDLTVALNREQSIRAYLQNQNKLSKLTQGESIRWKVIPNCYTSKIYAIKDLRELTGLCLKDAKDVIEGTAGYYFKEKPDAYGCLALEMIASDGEGLVR